MRSTFLSAIQSINEGKLSSTEKSQMMKRFEQVYKDSFKRISQKCQQQNVISQLQKYYQQVKQIFNQQAPITYSLPSSIETSRAKSISDELACQQQTDPAIQQQQSEYMFLRSAWQSKYEPSQGYDVEDHIDRINKVVAMVRMRTNYMIRKEQYFYQKEEMINSYIFENPMFVKMKQELEKMTMKNQELAQRCHFQNDKISQLQTEKSTLLQNFTNMKKKYQQMQKSFIDISKRNICLQQDSLALKSHNSKNKLNSLRENTDFNTITAMELRRSTSFSKFVEQAKMTQRSTQPSQSTIKDQLTIPLQKVFIDISLNLSSKRQSKQQRANNRYMNSDSQNQQNAFLIGVRQRINTQNQEIQKLALCRSERLIHEDSPMRLKYIRNDNSSARKSLLLSAKSVDLVDKTSLTKPKFQRTKPNYQNIFKSVRKDDCVLVQANGEKQSLLKKHNVLNDGINLTKAFKNITREFAPQREQIN